MTAQVYVVMGVSGSGKSTVGTLLAARLACPFYDADDFHPPENIRKMSAGIPLTDEDRRPWLAAMGSRAAELLAAGRSAVMACSALKESYRRIISPGGQGVRFIYLKGDQRLIGERLAARKGHFMPPSLLQSQMEALEEPADAIVVDIFGTPDEIVGRILERIKGGEGRPNS